MSAKVMPCILLLLRATQCAKILGVFPMPSISHQFAFQPIWKELALRGHQVTVVSPNILKENITNLREIDVGHSYNFVLSQDVTKEVSKKPSIFKMVNQMMDFYELLMEDQWNNPEVKKILKNNETQFDLVIVEGLNPIPYALGAKFNAPVVGICSMPAFLNGQDAVGNPTHPVVTPEVFFEFPEELSFFNRLESFVYNIYFRIKYSWYWLPKYDKFIKSYFGDGMPSIPHLGDLERNVSLMLLNVNPLLHAVRPNVPAVIEISQLHIKRNSTNKHLSSDLKKYLDEAKEGFIYFSLGSNIKSASLDIAVRQIILEALGELPYKVLWKWETDHLPGQPKNVKISKWLPQQEVLSHPNIKAFVTQGGIQSIEEALSHGVPVVGIPFMADQTSNVVRLVKMGAAKYLEFDNMSKDDLKNAILEVAGNEKYKKRAKELGSLLTDVPMKGLDKAVWWIEYVLRHRGATHLVSPTRDMPYWKYYCLDVIGVLMISVVVSFYIVYNIIGKVVTTIINNTKIKLKVS